MPNRSYTYSGRPRILVLGCKAGGSSMGYYLAGFDPVGIDIQAQPHYPFPFHKYDALSLLAGDLRRMSEWPFAAIHASMPCQKFTRFQQSQPQRENRHLDLVTPIRPLLIATGLPWVIENVPGSPLRDPVQLCGTAFGLGVKRGQLWRHRWFEASFAISPGLCHHDGRPAVMVTGHGVDGYRGSGLNAAEAREAMQIDWMNRDEMAQAIPPAFTHHIGKRLMAQLLVAA